MNMRSRCGRSSVFAANCRRLLLVVMGASCFVATLSSSTAKAQAAPDIRDIRPHVFLMVDTSGSMERLPQCACTTPVCSECMPSCAAGVAQRNRWSTVLESLTGSWNNYACSIESRDGAAYIGQYDYLYYVPHVQISQAQPQNTDGILDVYVDRIKFGLLTFDGLDTLIDSGPLVPVTQFQNSTFLTDSAGVKGMFSYGTPKELVFPGCTQPYMIDNGAQNENASSGALVRVGTDSEDHRVRNASIQTNLLAVRPFGPTPIAGMLDDLRYHIKNDDNVRPVSEAGASGDRYYACRKRYAMMITDGYPNADFRGDPFRCETPGYTCPYQTPEEIAADLCAYSTGHNGCSGRLNGLFVIGFDVDGDSQAINRLNDLADAGGTQRAYLANDRGTLMNRLAQVLDQTAKGTTTRTVPAFAAAITPGSQTQFEFNSGFMLGETSGDPWRGVLERRRYQCQGLVAVRQEVTDADRFHKVLNAQAGNRRLLSLKPADPAATASTLYGNGTADVPSALNPRTGQDALSLVSLDTLTPSHFGLPATNESKRDEIIAWVRGDSRSSARLGDIYHSSPVVIGPPATDIADEAFNQFRRRDVTALRPTVAYFGTNDGLLHAMLADDYNSAAASSPYSSLSGRRAGEELWGFVPPILLSKLEAAKNSHQWMVDGAPIVRDVFYARAPGQSADDQYHTVLITGLRGGGKAFVAMDVTNPMAPKFLWQFAHPDMGNTYGQAAFAQVLVSLNGQIHERAVAILPGGSGEVSSAASCPANGLAMPPTSDFAGAPRASRRCWKTTGRQLYIVDVATGALLKHINSSVFTAPLNGGVSVYSGDVGTIASRAFFTDADGVVWRLDMSSTDPESWRAAAFHDIFWGSAPDAGQPAYPAPALSVDTQGRVIILQATGDIDLLDDPLVQNRVVSLTEKIEFGAAGGANAVQPILNWEIRLALGEQTTGPLELFNSSVYFGTFRSVTDIADACGFGQSRLWGVKYIEAQSEAATPRYPAPALMSDPDSGVIDRHNVGPYSNQIVMGVSVTQRPRCFDSTTRDGIVRVLSATGGQFQLVAQVSGNGGARSADGGSVSEIVLSLPTANSVTTASSLAGAVE